jgi:hypothetical protein
MSRPKKTAAKGGFSLYLNSASDYSIVDDDGNKYTVAQARELMESGAVTNYNLSLRSLAACEWDVERLKSYYAKC